MEKTKFQKFVTSFSYKLYLLKNLPFGFLAGLKVVHISENKAVVSIPFNYLTKNPFNSMYFAAQSMAAEMATAVLAMNAIYSQRKPVSMLVLSLKASFTKKAKSKIFFTCTQGEEIEKLVQECIRTGESRTIQVISVGTNKWGEEVSRFTLEWTFKPKD